MQDFSQTKLALDEYATLFKNSVEKKDFVPKESNSHKDRQNVKPHQTCVECPYKTICRTTYTVAGKNGEF